MSQATSSRGIPADYFSSSDDEDGFSDDNEYWEYKQRVRASHRQTQQIDKEVEEKQQRLKSLFSAITYGRTEKVIEELDKGLLDIEVDLDSGWTPLLLASTVGNYSLLKSIIDRGANVNQSRDGTTPLMLVCGINYIDEMMEDNILLCARLLLENNADVTAMDNKRRTAIMFAANKGHLGIVKLLLPLVDKEAEDNQRWNVLFWAVDGNQIKIVEYLLNQDFNCDKTDIRSQTAAQLAQNNGFHDILDLFPKDPFEHLYVHLNNDLNFEDTFKDLQRNEKPRFFNSVCKMLYGTRSEQLVPIFADKKVSLFDFLSLNDERLKDMDVDFPYQRKRILSGLYRFHSHPFRPQSVPFVNKDDLYTNIDVATALVTCIKQIVAMEASLKFIIDNSKEELNASESEELDAMISKLRKQIKQLKSLSQKLTKKAEQWDNIIKPVDKITKKRRNIPWGKLWLTIGIVSLVAFYALK